MRLKKKKRNLFGMFKVFKFILRLYNNNITHFINFQINEMDFICLVNLIQSQIFDYILYKLFKKYVSFWNYFLNNYQINFLIQSFRFNNFTNDVMCIGMFSKNRFYWTNFSYNPIKFFNTMKNNFNKITFSRVLLTSKKNQIHLYINLKKQLGLIKRKDKVTYNTLVYANSIRTSKYYNYSNFISKNVEFSKIFDIKKKTLKNFILNRLVLKNHFLMTTSRQKKLTKFFSKNTKISNKQCIDNFESSLLIFLIKAKFVFTLQESVFLIKNQLIYVNGVVCSDIFKKLSIFDVVNIVYSKKYFYFFKTIFNAKLKLVSFLSYRLWRYNRFRSNFYKQSPSSLPNWINTITYFYYDIPSYLEVDYLTLSGLFIKSDNYQSIYFSKYINTFLFRLYNWKYLN